MGFKKTPIKPPTSEINIKKLIQVLRKSGTVAISSEDGINLVTNTHFILVISDDELWEIQASLKLRNTGYLYHRAGNSFFQYSDFPKSAMALINKALNTKSALLKDTMLRDCSNSAYLARDGSYVLVSANYLDIFPNINTIHQGFESELGAVLINGKHLICPIRADHNKYLKQLINSTREAAS